MYYTQNGPELVEAAMFFKLNKSLIPNDTTDAAESSICNTLNPSHHELPDAIDNSNDNEGEDDDDDDDLSPMPIESEEANYTCRF